MIAVEDKHFLEKIGCDTLIDLALVVPTSFEDTTLYTQALFGKKQALLVEVRQTQTLNSNLKITLFCKNLNQTVSAMIFHPKPYHYAIFKSQTKMVIYGALEETAWGLQVSQPQKISKVGEIIANYPSRVRSDTHQRLVRTYINVENLMSEGLPESVVQTLVEIFNKPKESIEFYNLNGVTPKERDALKFAECYNYMKKLQKKRFVFPALSSEAVDPKSWIETLPFSLTQDQLRTIEDIYGDLRTQKSAKRMVIGDVGAGKTMAILATAWMNQKHRTILMAPTTLLAIQIYEEAVKLLPSLRSILITNKHNKKADLSEYDFLIGTHALLYKELPDTTVVMIDEQHRFGTKQRNQMDKMLTIGEARPHVFQFSATPIPRTQAMVNSALLDVSLIEQMPFKKDITTKMISKEDFSDLIEHITREIEEARQVLIIYPLVEESEVIEYQSIEEARSFWEQKFKNVYVTHGKDKDKESVLLEFRDKGSILVATTVVEVGISLPKLSTIVIVGAERLGFASLHQLRGRVSRTGLKGYCFLYSQQRGSKRLEAFSKVSSGFEIAALDLRYREGGDLLSGKRQSGSKYLWFSESDDEEVVVRVKEFMKIN